MTEFTGFRNSTNAFTISIQRHKNHHEGNR